MTICVLDLFGVLMREMLLKICYRARRLLMVSFICGIILLLCYVFSSFVNLSSELKLQASSWEEANKMFGKSRNKVLASYEHHLPRIGNLASLDAVWQTISDTKSKFLVYSAYYERRAELGRSIRVIGATRTFDSEPVWCRLWYGTEPAQSVSVLAEVKIIRENWERPYSACFVLCPLEEGMIVPHSVSVVRRLYAPPSNRLLVIDNYRDHILEGPNHSVQGKLAVCIQPIHNYNKTNNLVEFLELYSLLGADRFNLYNYNQDPAVDCILKDYVSRDVVTYLPWNLELVRDGQIWVHGIHAALNDCLYRNMYRYSNVVVVDLDEFIIPKHADTLVDFIAFMDSTLGSRHQPGSYDFRNAFFFVQLPTDVSVDQNTAESELLTISKTTRYVYLNPHRERSKYICKPERTVETGNHFVWEFVSGSYAVNVRPDLATSQHYRNMYDSGVNPGTDLVLDRTAHKYKGRLTRRVMERWTALREQCSLQLM